MFDELDLSGLPTTLVQTQVDQADPGLRYRGSNVYLYPELLFDFPSQGLAVRLLTLHFPTRELPFERFVHGATPLHCEYMLVAQDSRSHHPHRLWGPIRNHQFVVFAGSGGRRIAQYLNVEDGPEVVA